MLLTYKQVNKTDMKVFDPSQYSGSLPSTVDWRTLNAVTPVKRQVKKVTSKQHTMHIVTESMPEPLVCAFTVQPPTPTVGPVWI